MGFTHMRIGQGLGNLLQLTSLVAKMCDLALKTKEAAAQQQNV